MRILTPATVDQLLASIPERSPFGARDKALIVLDLHTGLRSHELVALNVGHVLTRDGSPASGSRSSAKVATTGRSRSTPPPARPSSTWCSSTILGAFPWRPSLRCWLPGVTAGCPPALCATSSSATASVLILTSVALRTRCATPSPVVWPAALLSRSCRSRSATSASAQPRSTPTPLPLSWRPVSPVWPAASSPARKAGATWSRVRRRSKHLAR